MRTAVTTTFAALTLLLPPAVGAQEAMGGGDDDDGLACSFRGAPEELADRASPPDSVLVTLEGSGAKLCYGAPSTRGRTMVGNEEWVPWGEPWRLGANEPTTLHLSFPAEIAGIRVEPGSYALYVVPDRGIWRLHVNGAVERWGIPLSDEVRAADVGVAVLPMEPLDRHVETLSFHFVPAGHATGHLVMDWERNRLRIPLERVGR